MSDAHTPGLLSVYNLRVYAADRETEVADCLYSSNSDQDAANARRLVAAWNACDGISTEELEHISATGGMLGPRDDIARIAAQRDELLSLLKRYAEMDRLVGLTQNILYRSSVEAINKVEQQ